MNNPVDSASAGPDFGHPEKVTPINNQWNASGQSSGTGGNGGGGSNVDIGVLAEKVSHIENTISKIEYWIYALVVLILACTAFVVDKQWEMQTAFNENSLKFAENSLKIERISSEIEAVHTDIGKVLIQVEHLANTRINAEVNVPAEDQKTEPVIKEIPNTKTDKGK